MRDVSNSAFLTGEIRKVVLGEVGVDHGVQSSSLIDVAADAILDAFRGVAVEVVWLPS